MQHLYLVAEADGRRFAMPASAVENVVRDMEVVSVPLADPSVAGIAALRSRVVTVVDLMAAICGEKAGDCRGMPIIVTKVDGHLYGFAVEQVRDIVEAEEAPKSIEASMSAGWSKAASGFVETGDGAVVVVEPRNLLAGHALAA